jgi:CubicO group peptidase (beta-lactamase class C family)
MVSGAASVSKVFVTIMLLQLRDRRLLSLDDQVRPSDLPLAN